MDDSVSINWLSESEGHDYPAQSYLSLLFDRRPALHVQRL